MKRIFDDFKERIVNFKYLDLYQESKCYECVSGARTLADPDQITTFFVTYNYFHVHFRLNIGYFKTVPGIIKLIEVVSKT